MIPNPPLLWKIAESSKRSRTCRSVTERKATRFVTRTKRFKVAEIVSTAQGVRIGSTVSIMEALSMVWDKSRGGSDHIRTGNMSSLECLDSMNNVPLS
jgi:hypothetical protein